MPQPLVVAIAGGSSAGKSTLTDAFVAASASAVSVLRHDDYYRDRACLPTSERGAVNFDSLDAVETGLFVEHLDQLIAGEPVFSPEYDFSTHTRRETRREVPVAPTIIVEGLMVLAEPSIRQRLDLAVYVELEADTRFMRRLARDTAERGRNIESVLEQYRSCVQPFQRLVVEASKQHADLVVTTQDFTRLVSALGFRAG